MKISHPSIRSWIVTLAFVPACTIALLSAAQANEGGIVGGGGNVIVLAPPMNKATVEQTHLVIQRALRATKYVLGNIEKQRSVGLYQSSAWNLLFSKTPDVFSVLHLKQLEIRDRSACRNADGLAYDGSTVSSFPNSICVSAKRLSEKVDVSELKPQSIALIVHEVSETMGLTDREAISLQRDVLSDLGIDPKN